MSALSVVRRTELNAVRNQRLASGVDLQLQLKQAHWSVNGSSFVALHDRFCQITAAGAAKVDRLVERIVASVGMKPTQNLITFSPVR